MKTDSETGPNPELPSPASGPPPGAPRAPAPPSGARLSGLLPEQRRRYAELTALLGRAVREAREHPGDGTPGAPGGFSLRLATGRRTWMLMAELLDLERILTPEAIFTLQYDEHFLVHLNAHGPGEVLRPLFARWNPAP